MHPIVLLHHPLPQTKGNVATAARPKHLFAGGQSSGWCVCYEVGVEVAMANGVWEIA